MRSDRSLARPLLEATCDMTTDGTMTLSTGARPRASLARRVLSERARRAARRGFTLVELAIVVAIVGVLAVIAVVGYRKLTLSAKVTEAKNMLSAIRIAQEDYKLERGFYANIGDTNHCPKSGLIVPLIKTGWDTTCNGGVATWSLLPVHSDGPVQFGYATVAGTGGTPPGYGFVNMTGGDATKPWYVAHAQADLDGTGTPNTELVTTSFTGQIFSQNEGY